MTLGSTLAKFGSVEPERRLVAVAERHGFDQDVCVRQILWACPRLDMNLSLEFGSPVLFEVRQSSLYQGPQTPHGHRRAIRSARRYWF